MFKVGDRVIHRTYGPGVVVYDEGYDADNTNILVRLDNDRQYRWVGKIGDPRMPRNPYPQSLVGMDGLWWCSPTLMTFETVHLDYDTDED